MYKRIFNKMMSPFWFMLILGVLGLVMPFWELGERVLRFSCYLVIGFFVGLGLGLVVFIVERSKYIRYSRRSGINTSYRTTSVWQYILIALTILIIVLNSRKETGYAAATAIAGGTYLLTLAIVLFQIQKNKQIIVS